jgi:hypothetical protein
MPWQLGSKNFGFVFNRQQVPEEFLKIAITYQLRQLLITRPIWKELICGVIIKLEQSPKLSPTFRQSLIEGQWLQNAWQQRNELFIAIEHWARRFVRSIPSCDNNGFTGVSRAIQTVQKGGRGLNRTRKPRNRMARRDAVDSSVFVTYGRSEAPSAKTGTSIRFKSKGSIHILISIFDSISFPTGIQKETIRNR